MSKIGSFSKLEIRTHSNPSALSASLILLEPQAISPTSSLRIPTSFLILSLIYPLILLAHHQQVVKGFLCVSASGACCVVDDVESFEIAVKGAMLCPQSCKPGNVFSLAEFPVHPLILLFVTHLNCMAYVGVVRYIASISLKIRWMIACPDWPFGLARDFMAG
jgi:hypothetical protein